MAAKRDKERAAGESNQEKTAWPFGQESQVSPPSDLGELELERYEAPSFRGPISPTDPASLQKAFHVDPRGTSKRIVESHDPAYAAPLASLLRAETTVRDEAARGLRLIELMLMGPAWMPETLSEELERTWELVETSDPDSLRKAFHADPSLADSFVDAALVISPVAGAVIPLFEVSLDEARIVSLYVAHALASIRDEPGLISQAIPIALSSAAALLDRPGSLDAIEVIASLMELRPLSVLPYLRPVLQKAGGSPAGHELLDIVDRLIIDDFRVLDGTPAEARHLTLWLLGGLLQDDSVANSLREKVETQVRAVVTSMRGDRSLAIEEAAKEAGVPTERIAWALWGDRLTSPEWAQLGSLDPLGAEWVIRHLSGAEEAPWTWRVYDHIVRFSPNLEFRIEAARRLGEYGPTSIEDPLPADVQDLRKLLEHLSKSAESPRLRRATEAALARNRERGEEVPPDTRISICAAAWRFPAALPSECFIASAHYHRLPILFHLPLFPGLRESFHVSMDVSMDVPQEVSRAPTPAPDIDLSTVSFATADTVSPDHAATSTTPPLEPSSDLNAIGPDLASEFLTTSDPQVQLTRMLLVREAGTPPLPRAPGEDLSDSAIRAQIDDAVRALDSIAKAHSEFIPTITSSLRHLQAGLGEQSLGARAQAPGGEKTEGLSAQETIEGLKKLREPEEIQRFLERFVVGKTWQDLDGNKCIANGVTEHLETLKLRVACARDGQPSLLRCYQKPHVPTGAFVFEHYTEGSQKKHGGTTTVPQLKVVPEGPDLRRKSRQISETKP